jgi:hypothetical protein
MRGERGSTLNPRIERIWSYQKLGTLAVQVFFSLRYVHVVKDYGTGYVHIKSVEKTLMRPITDRKYTIKRLLMVGTKRLKEERNLHKTNI